ncbi:MAG: hypothetical protein JSR19_12445 [Proteobacteria bacterium]|nr:hypothetical protein [Pseudomonadota bacterium]HQR03371.1 hypothetical protein [Rhodocyclaceae bacterium]
MTFLVGSQAWAEDACAPRGEMRFVCGLHQPGDIEVLPGGRQLAVTQMNMSSSSFGVGWGPGQLTAVNTQDDSLSPLYPRPSAQVKSPVRKGWGDPACPGEIGTRLSPGGLFLSRRPDGAWQLLVVNHGVRESIEFFEVIRGDVEWRGCVIAPPSSLLGDVAAIHGGGFAVTNRVDGHRLDIVAHLQDYVARGKDTGFVYTWHASHGWRQLPHSEGTLPLGIESDAGGKAIYVAYTGPRGEIRKLDVVTGARLATAQNIQAERLSWDGKRLLATGLDGPYRVNACGRQPGRCPAPFHVTALDPMTLAATRVTAQGGGLVEGATVAVSQGKRLWIGAFLGNRILSIPR